MSKTNYSWNENPGNNNAEQAFETTSFKTGRASLLRPAFLISNQLIVLFASLAAFLWLASHRYGRLEMAVDAAAFQFFAGLVSAQMTRIAEWITFMGTGSFLIPVYASIVFIYIKKGQKRKANMIILAVVLSFIAGCSLKMVFHFARPEHRLVTGAGGFSFPSGHALGGFTLSAVVFCLLSLSSMRRRNRRIIAAITGTVALLIGVSRIYLRVHFAMDVIGSFLVAVCLSQLLMIYANLSQRLSQPAPAERMKSLTS